MEMKSTGSLYIHFDEADLIDIIYRHIKHDLGIDLTNMGYEAKMKFNGIHVMIDDISSLNEKLLIKRRKEADED